MVNYELENLPVPFKHLCNPIQQNKVHMLQKYTFKRKNLYGKCIPCFFLYNNDRRIVILKFLAG